MPPTTQRSTLAELRGTTGHQGPGTDDMLVNSAGLWVAGDNFDGLSKCTGVYRYAGSCFLRNCN